MVVKWFARNIRHPIAWLHLMSDEVEVVVWGGEGRHYFMTGLTAQSCNPLSSSSTNY